MKCPQCAVDLLIGEKTGIEIDYCPKCRGIWLDRGELDKIVERMNELYPQANVAPSRNKPHYDDDHHDREKRQYKEFEKSSGYEHGSYNQHGYKKKNFLSDLFDF
ncbi:MAG: zf-TFIIB domain-containing protein [Ignavibacteriales bacterium]|nr:zf-TFIIB domain-containing protein [Ignavibacteriales bacterium]